VHTQIDQWFVISGDFFFVLCATFISHTLLSSVHRPFCLGYLKINVPDDCDSAEYMCDISTFAEFNIVCT
jgi:hypothetical protein